MSEISKISRLITGASRNVSLSTNTLVVDNIKIKLGTANHVTFLGILTGSRAIIVPDADVNLGNINSLTQLSGVAAGNVDLGIFDKTIIPDNLTIKEALQSLEDYIDSNLGGDNVDSSFRIVNDLDTTKKIAFNASNISALTERTIAMPDEDVDLGLIGITSSLLATEITNRTNADNLLDGRIDTLEADPVTKTYVDTADGLLSARILELENIANIQISQFFISDSSVFTDGRAGQKDPGTFPREGWYFKNSDPSYAINWLFFDNITPILLDDFSAYAVMTFDNASEVPVFSIETAPTGVGDADPTFHSRIVFSAPPIPPPTTGTKYVVFLGQEPSVHPSLPRIQLSLNPLLSLGDQLGTEVVLRCYFSSNILATVNSVEWMVEKLGVSGSFKYEAILKINELSIKEKFPISSVPQLTSIDLANEAIEESIVISVDRLMLHEDDDYTVSLVATASGSITRITWVGDVAIGGSSQLEIGDNIRVSYRYNA